MSADDRCTAVAAILRGAPCPAGIPLAGLIACAHEHRVHLLLAERLSLPESSVRRRAAAALDAAREPEVRRVVEALAANGVRPVLIKGAALAYTHYPRPELRPRTDTDLMIPARARDDVSRVLVSLGYTRPTETDGELSVSQCHFQRADGVVTHALDVHWRMSNVLAFADVLSYDEIARDAIPLPALGPHARGPSTVHSLILACIHRVAHHGESTQLLWLYDLHLLAGTLDRNMRAAVTRLAASRGVQAVCAASLRCAAEAFGGAAGDLAAAIEPPPGRPEATAAFLDLKGRPIDLLSADLVALDTWSKRWQLVREHVFPAREYMFARYGTRRPLSLPWLYLRRLIVGMPKWFRQ